MDKQMLYSQDAETAVLGAVLIDPDTLLTLDLSAADFYNERNRWIWTAITELNHAGTNIDVITLADRLEAKSQLAPAGGPAYLIGLLSAVPTSMHAQAYAEVIKDKSRRRAMLTLAGKIANAAYDEGNNLERAIPGFIQSLVDTSRVKNGARPFSEYVSDLYDDVGDRAANPREVWGIPSGFPTLDRITGGWQDGELTIFSGEPGVGKSILVMQMAEQMGHCSPGAIYSIEMSGKQVARRLVSGISGISNRALKTGNLEDDDWPLFTDAVDRLSSLPIYMSDGANWTTASLRADLSRLKAQHGIKWFVLDYLFLLEDGAGQDEIERTALASKGLKRTAKELGLAGIAVHSMNKEGMKSGNGAPNQGNLRGSGQVIYDADLIMFLTKYNADLEKFPLPVNQRDNVRMLVFGKGRELEDPRKYLLLTKRPELPAFAEYAPEVP